MWHGCGTKWARAATLKYMRITWQAVLAQFLFLGGVLTLLQAFDSFDSELFIYAGCAYSFFRPVPNDFLYPRNIIRWQLPFIRLFRTFMWAVSAFIAWAGITFLLALAGIES